MNFLKKNFIFLIIFITGAAVLIIEVTATRILAPYFGNTLFTVSSIIGIILGALSLGYYLGGVLADRYCKFSIFFYLIFFAGIFSFLIQPLSKIILPILGDTFSMRIGPPISALILFFFPSLILGMMSPFAIKLKILEVKEIGKISGGVFFWSTLGSIVGSFLAGFFLIPNFGVSKIIISTSLVLVLIGLLGLCIFKKAKNFFKKPKTFISLIFILIFSFLSYFLPKSASVIFQKDGVYGQIKIVEKEIRDKKARILIRDLSHEGAVFLESNGLPFEYTRYYSLYNIINSQAQNALFLGGGAYSIPRRLLLDKNFIQKVDIVEIEPELFQLAKKYFRLQGDSRLFNHITDGRRFLRETNQNYDMIFSDVYSSVFSIPVHFTTQEFFSLAKSKLSNNGFFLANIIGTLEPGVNQFLLSEIKTFSSVFPNSYFFAIESPDSKDLQNFIFLGLKDRSQKLNFESQRILENENEIIRNLPQKILNPESLNFNPFPIFTDDYAPVEYFTSKFF